MSEDEKHLVVVLLTDGGVWRVIQLAFPVLREALAQSQARHEEEQEDDFSLLNLAKKLDGSTPGDREWFPGCNSNGYFIDNNCTSDELLGQRGGDILWEVVEDLAEFTNDHQCVVVTAWTSD
jgi:hypothetical protein